MPRGRVSLGCSNLSLLIPRTIHHGARIKAIRSGAPSFAAYVATVLAMAPERMTAAELVHSYGVELVLKAGVRRRKKSP